MPPSYYEILEIPQSSAVASIRKAYHRLAIKHHPDKNPPALQDEATKKFKLIAEAYEVLSDEKRRLVYDNQLNNPSTGSYSYTTKGGSTNGFKFRSPEEVFFDFFNCHHADFWGGSKLYGSNGNTNPGGLLNIFNTFDPFQSVVGFDDLNRFGGTTTTTNTSGMNVRKSSSTSTRFINGKKITTRKVTENGIETTTIFENDAIKCKSTRDVR